MLHFNLERWTPVSKTNLVLVATLASFACLSFVQSASGQIRRPNDGKQNEKDTSVLTLPRVTRVVNTSGLKGTDVTVAIELDSNGDEVATSFSLNFNPAILTISGTSGGAFCGIVNPNGNPDVCVGNGAPPGTGGTVNATQVANGRIGIVLFNGSLLPFTASPPARQAVTLKFHIALNAPNGPTPIGFVGQGCLNDPPPSGPTGCSTSDGATNPLPMTFADGAVTVTGPTAAETTVGGRVTSASGYSIASARISLTDSLGVVRTAMSNGMGYFRINGVQVGETYVLSATSKRFSFTPRLLTVTDEISDLTLISDN